MKEIIFFKGELVSCSPLKIGNGEQLFSGSDLLIDSEGVPYIPGTALAGCCKHYLDNQVEDIEAIFGSGSDAAKLKSALKKESNIIFYDAVLKAGKRQITLRDGVALSSDKTANEKGKFDYEVLEKNCIFEFKLELKVEDEDVDSRILDKIISGINQGEITFGGKTSRGFGRFMLNEMKILTIHLAEEIEKYIDFSWKDVVETYQPQLRKREKYDYLKLKFDVVSFLMIGNPATNTFDKNGRILDSEQRMNSEGNAVIPGTSWAGTFRHRFEQLLAAVGYEKTEELVNDVFGCSNKDGGKTCHQASKIVFGESEITGSILKRTRTAIDRFTGGACDKMLFTYGASYGGCGELEIYLRKDIADKKLVQSLIKACIQDFNDGYLSIGGQSSIGGGLLQFGDKEAVEWD